MKMNLSFVVFFCFYKQFAKEKFNHCFHFIKVMETVAAAPLAKINGFLKELAVLFEEGRHY